MSQIFENSKERLEEICQRYGVKKLELFGSAARSDFGPESDIDILIRFLPDRTPSLGKLVELQDELADLFGRSVQLATSSILENPYRRKTVEKDLRALYAA